MEHFIALAFRNIFRQKKRSFTLGINYAIVAFILVLLFAFSNGARKNIFDSLTRASAGHITITGRYAQGGKVYAGILRSREVAAAATETLGSAARVVRRYQVQSALYFNGLSKRLSFVGVDTQADDSFRGQLDFVQGSYEEYIADPSGLVVSRETADYFGFGRGDEVVVSSRTRFGAFNTGILTIRGVYETDNYFTRGLTLTHFEFLRNLDLADPEASTSIYVYLPSVARLDERRDDLSRVLAGKGFETSSPRTDSEAVAAVSAASIQYESDEEGRDRVMLTLATIDEALGIVNTILGAVNAAGALIAGVMLFVIAVSIFINLRMTINERLREIGTLRAIGVEAGGVTTLFVLESLVLSIAFSAAGAILAVAVSAIFRTFIPIPPGGEIGLFLDSGRLVLLPRLADTLATIGAVALFSVLFSYFPARRGGRIPPVVALTRLF